MYCLATLKCLLTLREKYSVPQNIEALINQDLKRYCAQQIVRSLVRGEYVVSPDKCVIPQHKALLQFAGGFSISTADFLRQNTDMLESAVRLFSKDELMLMLNYAIYKSHSSAKDPIT